MNTVMTKEELAQILDQALRDVTEQTAGVRLHQGDQPPAEDVEEFGKEYLNVLCGKVTGAVYQATRIPAHFGQPVFCRGSYKPKGQEVQFILTYSNEHSEGAQLIHHVPCGQGSDTEPGRN